MTEALTFGNVEKEVADYLDALLAVPARRVITDDPDSFVKVILTGTRRRNLALADASVTLESHARGPNADADAEALARLVYGHMSAFSTPTMWIPADIERSVTGPFALTDPTRETPRYDQTWVVRQAAITVTP